MKTNFDTCNKKTLAEYLDVSVRSIDRFTSKGMPCTHAEKVGDENVYVVGLCIHWYVGYMENKPYKLKETDGLVLTLLGYAASGMSAWQLENKGREIAKITGHSEFDVGNAIGILKQGNLVGV